MKHKEENMETINTQLRQDTEGGGSKTHRRKANADTTGETLNSTTLEELNLKHKTS